MGAIIVFAVIAALALAIDSPLWTMAVHRLEERASRKISEERMAEARESGKP